MVMTKVIVMPLLVVVVVMTVMLGVVRIEFMAITVMEKAIEMIVIKISL